MQVSLFAYRLNPELDEGQLMDGVDECMKKIQEDAFSNNNEMIKNNVDAVAEYLWSSAKKFPIVNYVQLCSVINAVIREDRPDELRPAVMIIRNITTRLVTRRLSAKISAYELSPTYPPEGETWRGGGFDPNCRPFFEKLRGDKKYRVPGFLASSTDKSIAETFASVNSQYGAKPSAVWRIKFDRRGKTEEKYRVRHMSFVMNTSVPGEAEYLFAPYSVFTLQSVKWGTNPPQHHFVIKAAIDNREEDEDLPLAPWY